MGLITDDVYTFFFQYLLYTEVLVFGNPEAYYIISEDSFGNMYKTKTSYATYTVLNRGDDFYLNVNVKKTR